MRILIADDQSRVRYALRVLLEQQFGFKIAGEAIDTHQLLRQVETLRPDLLLLDWDLPGLNPKNLLPEIHNHCPQIKVIVITSKSELRQAALATGVDAFVSKGSPPEALLAAVELCSNGCLGNDR
jgi:DNA-binding NarL/FixJ family response regulator